MGQESQPLEQFNKKVDKNVYTQPSLGKGWEGFFPSLPPF